MRRQRLRAVAWLFSDTDAGETSPTAGVGSLSSLARTRAYSACPIACFTRATSSGEAAVSLSASACG